MGFSIISFPCPSTASTYPRERLQIGIYLLSRFRPSATGPRENGDDVPASVKDIFDRLSLREKLYSHHLAQAAWRGSRIVLRQTSPESEGIFGFIIELHKACEGQWSKLTNEDGVGHEDVESFLDYAGQFLAHLGNYYVRSSLNECNLEETVLIEHRPMGTVR